MVENSAMWQGSVAAQKKRARMQVLRQRQLAMGPCLAAWHGMMHA